MEPMYQIGLAHFLYVYSLFLLTFIVIWNGILKLHFYLIIVELKKKLFFFLI